MADASLKTLAILIGFTCLPTVVFAQDETAAPAAAPSMQDVLQSLEHEPPTPVTNSSSIPTSASETAQPAVAPVPETPHDDLKRITPPDDKPAIPTGTMVKPPVQDSAPTENVPARPLENMNPALMPQTPADEAPKAVRAETAPVPPKPPAYEAQPFVTLQTLDKVTARTATMTVKVGDTVAIGPLFVQVKTCQKAAPLETPDNAAFLQVWEAKPKDVPVTPTTDKGPSQWVFSGWMFASSPALSAMDHPIYDIWVLNCKKSATDDVEKSAVEKDAGTKDKDKPADVKKETAAPVEEISDDEAPPAAAPRKASSSNDE